MDSDKVIRQSKQTLVESTMQMAKLWASCRSKDPRSKVGACIYDLGSGAMFFGYNGFPKGVADYERDWRNTELAEFELRKYDLVVHAEMNAIRKALAAAADLENSFLVCSHHPCPDCMKNIIASSGIRTVYYENDTYSSFDERARFVCTEIANKLDIKLIKVETENAG